MIGQTPMNSKGYIVFMGKEDGIGQDAADFFSRFQRNEEVVVIGAVAAVYGTYLFVHIYLKD